MIRFRPYPVLTVWAILGVALLVGLGQWQLYRLHWKLGLISAAETRSKGEPVSLESLLGKPARAIEYTHAAVQGEFLQGKTAYQFSQLEDGRIGFELLQPMRLADGRFVLIDRGFVPQGPGDKPLPTDPVPQGQLRITGLVRGAERPGWFTPAPDLEGKVWYARDIPAISAELGLGETLPFLLAADRTGPVGAYPEGGHTRLKFRNQHLQYALTWFALAGALFIIYLAYHRKRGRLAFGPRG